jgi:(p)ppGpp synthase/HD superfamily hydrolase
MDFDLNIINAIDVARRAHRGQVRKYTDEPYLTHPFAVAGLVASVTDDESMICAALLHDVVEDSDIKIETISGIFGLTVASLVADLTDVSKPEDGNRAARKAIDRTHTSKASVCAKTIKLADLIDNTKSITAGDKSFAEVYMAEKRLLLEVLTEGSTVLFDTASSLVHKYYTEDK